MVNEGMPTVRPDIAGDGPEFRQQIIRPHRGRVELAVQQVIPVVELETAITRELSQLVQRQDVGRPVVPVRAEEHLPQRSEDAVVDAIEYEYEVVVAGGSGLAAGPAAVPEGARQVLAEARRALVDHLTYVGGDIGVRHHRPSLEASEFIAIGLAQRPPAGYNTPFGLPRRSGKGWR